MVGYHVEDPQEIVIDTLDHRYKIGYNHNTIIKTGEGTFFHCNAQCGLLPEDPVSGNLIS